MAEKTSQSHNNGAWKRMVDEHATRVESMHSEIAKMEDKGIERMQSAVDESARLMKDTLAWYGELSAEFRKMTIEATKRSAELFLRAA